MLVVQTGRRVRRERHVLRHRGRRASVRRHRREGRDVRVVRAGGVHARRDGGVGVLVVRVWRWDLGVVGGRRVHGRCRVHVAAVHCVDLLLLVILLLVRRIVVLATATSRASAASASSTTCNTAGDRHHVNTTSAWRTLPSRQMTIVHPAGLGSESLQWSSTMVNTTARPTPRCRLWLAMETWRNRLLLSGTCRQWSVTPAVALMARGVTLVNVELLSLDK